MIVLTIVFLLIFEFLSGCTPVVCRYQRLTAPEVQPRLESEDVLLLTEMPMTRYQPIGLLYVEAPKNTSIKKLNAYLLGKAKSVGADAVINIKYTKDYLFDSEVFPQEDNLLSSRKKHAQGVAVKFRE